MLHQCFLLGVLYELDMFGEITTRLFEQINTRFFKTTSVNKYFTMIYGEISEEGRFRFISAAHPPPVVFSREYQKIMPISRDSIVTFPPVGTLPSVDDRDPGEGSHLGYKKRYTVNELHLLGPGDLMVLCTDGLADHDEGRFLAGDLERCLRDAANESAQGVCAAIRRGIVESGSAGDDVSFVVIKKR
jgi:serine phosphatase RsbU (regulator of sigma subunit)